MLRRLSIAVAGVLALLVGAELVLRLLPVSTATMTGYHLHPDILAYPPGHRWTVSTGWDLRNAQTLRANNWGFAADVDFVRQPAAIALIGDSYVEASMLDAPDRPAAQLQQRLGGRRPVYGLGSPGTALLDYAQRIRLAYERFGIVEQVVWLETGDARQALCGSGNVHSRCLDPATLTPRVEHLAEPGALKRFARHSALAQYAFGQLKLDARQLAAALGRRQVPAEPATVATAPVASGAPPDAPTGRSRQVVDAVLRTFFDEIGSLPLRRLIFVVDGRRVPSATPRSVLERERDHLVEQLRARGAEVIDLEPVYARHAGASSLSVEIGPYDRHLNRLGVGLVAAQMAAALGASGR